jgi:methionyl-tRNA formyltransferase
VLKKLVHAKTDAPPLFEVTTVITKGAEGEMNKVLPLARSLLDSSRIKHLLTPPTAKDEEFLHTMSSLKHDLYITAAIGLILPQKLLDIPRLGTINIHPSLLPRWRGASPVQRCIEAGDTLTGVSLTYTVLKCDAGPVLETTEVPLRGTENGDDLLYGLFELGGDRLMARMGDILSGRGRELAVDQSDSLASYATKIKREEARLDVRAISAVQAFNKTRAFSGSPGTFIPLILHDTRLPESPGQTIDLDVSSSIVVSEAELPEAVRVNRERVHFYKGRVLIPCREEGMLEVIETGKGQLAKDWMRRLGKHSRLSLA